MRRLLDPRCYGVEPQQRDRSGGQFSVHRVVMHILSEGGIDQGLVSDPLFAGFLLEVEDEVIVEAEFYTYDAKYTDDASRFVAPADLSRAASSEVRGLAERVFVELGLSGLARVDFFYDNTNGSFLFNEVNTMPGFTSISGFPKMWIASGMTYAELCSTLVDAAMARRDERQRLSIR